MSHKETFYIKFSSQSQEHCRSLFLFCSVLQPLGVEFMQDLTKTYYGQEQKVHPLSVNVNH